MKKRIVKILSWSAFYLLVIGLLIFVDYSYSAIPSSASEIHISQVDGHHFITEESVMEQVYDLGYSLNNQPIGEIETQVIENEVRETAGVKSAEVYELNDGKLVLDIQQSRPIARIIASNGLVSFYLDEDGETIPLSQSYTARVPVFSGAIYYMNGNLPNAVAILKNDSLSNIHLIDDIYNVASALDKNDFIKTQTLQVYVNDKKEFELIPRVGKNRVLLGESENIKKKLKHLTTFYTEVIDPKELNNYDTINLKYNNQIVCSKR